MAFDAITGKAFVPQFEGQRTGVDIDFDPAEWQEAWETNTQGDVEARALADIRAAMGQGDTATDQQVQNVFSQLFGGYNPNIDYRAEGVTPNVFLRSGEGLGGWEAMGRPTAESGPRGVPLGYGVPEINPATTTVPTSVLPTVPTSVLPTSTTSVLPTSTRRTTATPTTTTPTPTTTAPAAEVDPAIAQREIIERALAAKLKPIQNALAAGLLDVQAAQTAWDTARSEIYGDFLTEQTGVQQGFQTQQEADEAKRLTGRTKLLQDLNAAGVDSGMVADELALIDAIAEGSGQERMGLIGDMGRIGLMSNADRRMMGEGIFGGYEQDLRSQARQATLGAELDAAGQIQTAEERALSAGRLSDYMGIPVEALMADLYSDIDLTGMATGREEMDWGTGERLGAQDWQTGERIGAQDWQTGERIGAQAWGTSERIGGQDWQSAENVLDRTFATDEREAVQEFTSDERIASQDWAHDESIDQRDWESAEAGLGRTFNTSEREAIQDFNRLERMMSEQFAAGESATARNWQSIWNQADLAQQREELALRTAAQEEAIRQFGVGENQWQQTFDQSALTSGIDPATGQYLAYDPADPYAAFSPQEQYAAMTENQLPLTALLPRLAETPEDQQKIAEFMGQFATATAMGQEVTDEAVITALASNADLMHLIPQLMSLQMQDWRTEVPETGGGFPLRDTWSSPTSQPTLSPESYQKPSAYAMPGQDDFQFSLNPFAYDWSPDWLDNAWNWEPEGGLENAPNAWTDMWGGEAGWNPLDRDWRLWEGIFPGF